MLLASRARTSEGKKRKKITIRRWQTRAPRPPSPRRRPPSPHRRPRLHPPDPAPSTATVVSAVRRNWTSASVMAFASPVPATVAVRDPAPAQARYPAGILHWWPPSPCRQPALPPRAPDPEVPRQGGEEGAERRGGVVAVAATRHNRRETAFYFQSESSPTGTIVSHRPCCRHPRCTSALSVSSRSWRKAARDLAVEAERAAMAQGRHASSSQGGRDLADGVGRAAMVLGRKRRATRGGSVGRQMKKNKTVIFH